MSKDNKGRFVKQPSSSKDLIQGLSVEVRDGNFDRAFKIFNKKVQTDGVIKEYRERRYNVTPSELKQKNKKMAKARWRKKLSSMNLPNTNR